MHQLKTENLVESCYIDSMDHSQVSKIEFTWIYPETWKKNDKGYLRLKTRVPIRINRGSNSPATCWQSQRTPLAIAILPLELDLELGPYISTSEFLHPPTRQSPNSDSLTSPRKHVAWDLACRALTRILHSATKLFFHCLWVAKW